jgi:hypothetical protein
LEKPNSNDLSISLPLAGNMPDRLRVKIFTAVVLLDINLNLNTILVKDIRYRWHVCFAIMIRAHIDSALKSIFNFSCYAVVISGSIR